MMAKSLKLAALLLLFVAPAYADTDTNVTLVIENDAGAVTMMPDMTRRECDAAAGLLSARKSSGISITGSVLTLNGYVPAPSPRTSTVTSAKCMTPAEKK